MTNRVLHSRTLAICLSLLVATPSFGQLQEKKDQEDSLKKPVRPTENLKSLTKLRREQKKRDPLAIEVEIPKDLHATTRELPVLKVSLKNVDEEKTPVWMWRLDDCGQPWRWYIEVRNEKGDVLSSPPQSIPGGLQTLDELAFGQEWKGELPMEEYARINDSGEYTIRVLYDCDGGSFHSRNGRIDSRIMCTSKEFKLKVEKAVPNVKLVPSTASADGRGETNRQPPIDLATMSEFHVGLKALCVHGSLSVIYNGPLGAPLNWRTDLGNNEPTYYCWHVYCREPKAESPHGIFDIQISRTDSAGADYECTVNGTKLFISVTAVDKARGEWIFKNSAWEQLRKLSLDDLLKNMKWQKKDQRPK